MATITVAALVEPGIMTIPIYTPSDEAGPLAQVARLLRYSFKLRLRRS
jgi:hypothetical protein